MISSRTPEGDPNRCPVCGKNLCLEPSTVPTRDAPCPHCGTLLEFPEPNTFTIPFAVLDVMERFARSDVRPGGAPQTVRIDFAGVEDFDSAALGKLITLHRKVQASGLGRHLVLFNVSPSMREAFRVTKLDKLMTIE